MKTVTTLAVLMLSISFGFSQEAYYQTMEAQMKITARRFNKVYQWENKNITVTIDYKTGDFLLRLTNNDFKETMGEPQTESRETDELIYDLKGVLPINDVINQKSLTQTYPLELQLVCESMNLDKTLNFQMEITRPGQGSGNFRLFVITGKLYNDEVQIPSFKSYDNEIELMIIFKAVAVN